MRKKLFFYFVMNIQLLNSTDGEKICFAFFSLCRYLSVVFGCVRSNYRVFSIGNVREQVKIFATQSLCIFRAMYYSFYTTDNSNRAHTTIHSHNFTISYLVWSCILKVVFDSAHRWHSF